MRREKISRPACTLANGVGEEALASMGRCSLPGIKSYDAHVSKEGKVYLKGLAEDVVDQPLCVPYWRLFQNGGRGQPPCAVRPRSVMPYDLQASTMVLLQPNPGTTLPPCVTSYENIPERVRRSAGHLERHGCCWLAEAPHPSAQGGVGCGRGSCDVDSEGSGNLMLEGHRGGAK